MRKLDQRGSLAMVLTLVLCILLLLGAAGFGFWAFASRQDYKNNVDAKISAAVAVAKKQEDGVKDNEFTEKEKNPLREYVGPAAFGSIHLKYPKTWSALIDESAGDSVRLNGYLHPNVIPGLQATTAFALRFQVSAASYDQEVQTFQASAQSGTVKVSAFKLPSVPNSSVGARVDGAITAQKQGSMVLLPLRDRTLKIWTESPDYKGDFDNIILPNMSFSP